MRTSIIIAITTLAATAALAVSAPAMADTWEDTPTGPDGGQGTVVDGTPQAGDEGGGYINEPQSGRGPSTSEWPGPDGSTRLRDILRPCTSDADALDGCYDASHDSGLWRSPEGHEYRTYDDGCWTLTPPGGSEPACPGKEPAAPASGDSGDAAPAADTDTGAGEAGTDEAGTGAEAADTTVQAPEGDSYSPSVEADAPEALADDATDADTTDSSSDTADTDATDSSGDTADDYEEYAADGTRTGLAHTGPASSTIAALAMGVAASAGAGASLMVLARADR